MPVNIFFCYTHEDEGLLNRLKRHLTPLRRQGLIDVWYDRDISAGTEWEQEIHQHLNAAQIILLLVSPDFIYSDYCYGIEMKRAIERHERGETQVIPIILRPVSWQGSPFSKLQALPTDAKPVISSSWVYQDEAFFNVVEGIRKVVEQLSAQPTVKPAMPSAQVVEEQQMQFSAPTAVTPAPLPAAEPTTPVVAVPHPAPTKPAKAPVAARTSSTVNVPRPKSATPLPLVKPEAFALLITLTGHTDSVKSLVFSPDGQTLTSVSADLTITLWNPWTGAAVRSLTGHASFPTSLAFSPDGQTLASGSGDGDIKLWNLRTGKQMRSPRREGSTKSLVFSPDGQILASGSWDGAIKLWDLATGKRVRSLTGHASSVTSLAFSPDGQILASGSDDRTIKLWGKK